MNHEGAKDTKEEARSKKEETSWAISLQIYPVIEE
jgi:hypothetical protein